MHCTSLKRSNHPTDLICDFRLLEMSIILLDVADSKECKGQLDTHPADLEIVDLPQGNI